MKLILLGCTPPPVGGIAQWTMRMLNSKLKNNWTIDLVDEKMIGGRESFGDHTKKNYLIEFKRWKNIWHTLNKKLKDDDAQVVHACVIASNSSMLANYVSAFLTKKHKKKFILHFRCTVPNMVNTFYGRLILKSICKKSDDIIVLNSQSKRYLEKYTKTPVQIVPNFIESEELNLEKRKINSSINSITYVGGCIKEKGCLDIINVAKVLPNIQFNLVGKASEEVIQAAKQVKNIKLKGLLNQKDVKKELDDTDVFIFLSKFWGEGFSNALAEAMGVGLPCIVSDWAANADMVENNKGGFVVKNTDIETVKETILLMEDANLRQKFSIFNLQKVKKEYTSRVILDEYVDIYETVLKG